MDKFIDSPWFLRLTALVLALILFFSVRAEEDAENWTPVGDSSDIIYDVPVELHYDEENLIVTGVPETVNVRIEGPTNIVQSTKLLKDFTVSLDVSNLPIGVHTVAFQHEHLSDKLQVNIDPAKVDIVIEERVTEKFNVTPEMNEQMIGKHHLLKEMQVSPKSVQITGPRSVIESIHVVRAPVRPKEEVTESYDAVVPVFALDRELNRLDVQVHPAEVSVSVIVEAQSKEVLFRLIEKGELQEGLTLDAVMPLTKTIRLYGSQQALDKIESITGELDLSKVTASGDYDVSFTLPEGISSAIPEQARVQVKVLGKKEDENEEQEEQQEEQENQEDKNELPEDETDVPEQPVEEQEDSTETEVSANAVEDKIETKKYNGLAIQLEEIPAGFQAKVLQPEAITITATGKHSVLKNVSAKDFQVFTKIGALQVPGTYPSTLNVRGPRFITWTLSQEQANVQLEQISKE